jgi:hypothetical protein
MAAPDQDGHVHDGCQSVTACAENLNYIVNDTIWNRSTRLPVYGPNAPKDWAYMQAMTFTAPTSEYRIMGNQLVFIPAPAAGDTCSFEYVTRNWIQSSSQTTFKDTFTADDDTVLLDWQLILLGLMWRWASAKGFDYDQKFQVYERRVADSIARDGTKPTLSLDGSSFSNRGIQPLIIAASGNWTL